MADTTFSAPKLRELKNELGLKDWNILFELTLEIQGLDNKVPKVSETAIAELVAKLFNIARKNFTTLQAFISRTQYLKRQIQEVIPSQTDEIIIYAEKLINEFSDKAVRESYDPKLMLNKAATTTNSTSGNYPSKTKRSIIKRFSKIIPFHEHYRNYYLSGDKECFAIHPEKKAEYEKRLKERELGQLTSLQPGAILASIIALRF
ncbi:hypothetical protein B0T17DRAFT_632932 [Bombardia bombarda]|uniref:Uncharacterized protein n=1 Tax=Bombardia bombarda TaxID=252184 RepID=A0AA39X7T3_9PEZI|nr:hypothetical protein B0T17DRAFT_632932 [Bombardia bombarda]